MTLLEIRKMLVRLSGRYDLVVDTTDYKDNGANFFIQAAVRMLDKVATHSKSKGFVELLVSSQQTTYPLPDLLSVTAVQVKTKDSGRVSYTLRDEEDRTQKDVGSYGYYEISTQTRSPLTRVRERIIDKLYITFDSLPEGCISALIYGRVSKGLVEDGDKNFWTLNYPETLIRAALYQIESFHRNRQGMNDYLEPVMRDVRQINNDQIESEVGSENQLRDSFYFRGEGNVR